MIDRVKNVFVEELRAMKERMDELYQKNFDPAPDHSGEDRASDWFPPVDIVHTDTEIIYILDLPGVSGEEIEVECKADRLWVSGSRQNDLPEGEPLHVERPSGPFSRIFRLPCPILVDQIQAEFKKGVLRIRVPKECSPGERAQRVFVHAEE